MSHNILDVIERGMCIGCGACSIATNGQVLIALSDVGIYQADAASIRPDSISAASSVCPFSDDASNEDQLADSRFSELQYNSRIGRHMAVLVGRISDDSMIAGSSSGGLTSYVLGELLDRGLVDAVLHVGRSDTELFEYKVTRSRSDLNSQRKSEYFSTTMAGAFEGLGPTERIAVVGVPCFIKAVRLLAAQDEEIEQHVAFYVGLVCGHLKSQFFAESLGWQAGVDPTNLTAVDFRVKNPNKPSNAYDYSATGTDQAEETRPMSTTIDGNWGYGAFQPEACNFCDDIFAETADVAFGDAWLPEYKADWRGTNVVVVRNDTILEILRQGEEVGHLVLEDRSPDDAAASQAGNFRHRRDGLQVRLRDDIEAGLSVPRKRVSPRYDHVSKHRRSLIRQRRKMSRLTLVNFAAARAARDFEIYARPLRAEIARYNWISAREKGLRQTFRHIAARATGIRVRTRLKAIRARMP